MRSARLVIFILLITLLIGFWSIDSVAQATLEACGASVSPSSVMTSVNTNFSFTITNNGTNPILYFQVAVPTADFSIQGKDASGWSGTSSSGLAQFWGGNLAPGATLSFSISATSGGNEIPSNNWIVDANDVLSTDGMTRCTGSLGTAISGVSDIIGPVIGDPTVTSIGSATATVNWTTDEAANSIVYYGLGSGVYGLSAEDASYVTSHSIVLTSGMAPDTTYYYYVCSLDQSGNQSCGDENSFTTATVSTSTTTTTTTVATPTPTPTPSASSTTSTVASSAPVVVADVSKPVVNINTVPDNPYEEAPVIEGSATDNRVISTVEYSTDGGINWLPVGEVSGLGSSNIEYSFTPILTEDGNYDISVRAIDNSSNVGVSDPVLIIIDRLPPRVGGNLLSVGPYSLLPNSSGIIVTLAGIEQRVTLSAVGGPTMVDLITQKVGDEKQKKFSLGRSADTGLWRGAINLNNPGIYELIVRAEDGAYNKTERRLGLVMVLRDGEVKIRETGGNATEGTITLYYQDPASKVWAVWDGEAFGQSNPQEIGSDGKYKFFLSPGSYYTEVKVPGKAKLLSEIFTLKESRALNTDFIVSDRQKFSIGPFRFPIPDIFAKKAKVILPIPEIGELTSFSVLGESLVDFSVPVAGGGEINTAEFNNTPFVLSFVNTWSPQSVEQISLIDKAVYDREIPLRFVFTQEAEAKVEVFASRGGYTSLFGVDRDGELVEEFGVSSVPIHYFIDRYGVIKNVIVDVMSVEEIKDELSKLN